MEPPVFNYYIAHFWQRAFPAHTIEFEALISKKGLHVKAIHPFISDEKQGALFSKYEKDLQQWLEKHFGKQVALTLTISFEKNA